MPETGESSAPAVLGGAPDTAAAPREHPAVAVLAAAYPDVGERARALGWLAWIAWRMSAEGELAWWDIPVWVGERKLRFVRIVAGSVTLGLFFGLGFALVDPGSALGAGAFAAFLGWLIGRNKRMSPGRLRRERLPQAMVPCWPQSWRDGVSLALRLSTGLFLRRKLIRMWGRPVADAPSATGDSSYRACCRSTVIDGLACVMSGVPAALLALVLGPPMLIIGGVLTGLCFLAALADGKVPPVKMAEVVLLVQRRHRVTFHRLLERGVERQVLRPAGARYRFCDAPVQEYLAAVYQAGLDARARRIPDAVAAARPGVRTRLIGLMSRDTIIRLAVVAGGAAGITIAVLLAKGQIASGISWDSWFAAVLGWLGVAVGTPFLVGAALYGLVRLTGWSLWVTSRLSPRVRVAVPVGVVSGAGLIVWLVGPVRHGMAVAAVALLPAALVAGVGSWAAALTHRRWRAARLRWLRFAGDLLLAATAVITTLLLADRTLLGAQAAVGLLLPVAVWLSIVAWRAMNASKRILVRAGTDIAVSLLLGATVVMLLVWLANLLRMPPAEVAVLRDALHRTDKLIDLPWQLWAALYTLLAGASLAFARWPAKLAKPTRWFTRLRVVSTANVGRRGLTGVHIGLLVIALIGIAAPLTVAPVLRVRLAARYTETLSDDLQVHGELTAYQEIRREVGLGFTPGELAVLIAMVIRIDDISRPTAGQSGATDTELDLARRLGELQAGTLGLTRLPALGQIEAAVARQAGFDAPVQNAEDLSKRIGELDHEQGDEDQTAELADQAAEQAATALATALRIPRIGDLEVVQIISEYLGSLIENSPLKDVLTDWAGRLTGAHAPPPPEEMVIPDPVRLKAAATGQVTRELATVPATDGTAVRRLLSESGIVAAVDLTNQVRYLQEDSGPCDGCARPEPSGQEPGQGPDEQEPEVFDG